jgi:hypothetical protein
MEKFATLTLKVSEIEAIIQGLLGINTIVKNAQSYLDLIEKIRTETLDQISDVQQHEEETQVSE